MPQLIELETDRLRLRQWRQADFAPFAQLNSDPQVMEFFPAILSRIESDAMAERCQSLIAERGWGLWATECKASGAFVGFIGLHVPASDLPFSPCIEVGWRLSCSDWGKGYATEGARAALRVAFRSLKERQVVSFTSEHKVRSRGVMKRLGMREDGLFDHPRVPESSGLRRHCLYRLTVEDYDNYDNQCPQRVP